MIALVAVAISSGQLFPSVINRCQMEKGLRNISSGAWHQLPLFASATLLSFLHERSQIATREVYAGLNEFAPCILIEAVLNRIRLDRLRLLDQPFEAEKRAPESLSMPQEFRVPFSGDALLWHLSPDPLDGWRPASAFTEEWLWGVGGTLDRPYGEIFRGELILTSAKDVMQVDLRKIRALIAHQNVIIDVWENGLRSQLDALCEPAILQ